MRKIIEKEMKDLPESFIVAFLTSPEKYFTVNVALLDYLVNKRKMYGIYVTMNKPYDTLVNILKKKNIDIKKLFFIDAISGITGTKKSEAKNCITLQGPTAITEAAIEITKMYNSKKVGFLIMDSLSTMLVYNNEATTTRFAHWLITQLRKLKLSGVILSLEKDMDKAMISSVTQFCDKIIKV